MEIQVEDSGNAWVVAVSGKLDAVSASEYEKVVGQLIAEDKTRLVVDFANLSYISSAGLRVLLSTAKQLKPKGGSVVFASLQDNVREVFEMTGFSSILGIHPSLAAALAAV
ncbi:STAS domain-containing protein [Azonexus sp.]|uniref:STAS domain-containing protein n=1 Tax=Azonexus sp. TaxID=1872668 RepID=UPI0039E5ADE1